ncbi:MAG TPA: hypothetical protein VKS78_00780 [Roseiarcus sp.]|nr:hypothetical protein [Roseiarcus sp.]
MDKKLISALGAASALALLTGGAAQSAPSDADAPALKPAQSFSELLDPIPNAAATLAAVDDVAQPETAPVQTAQYYHHHHHHQYYHHHHHYHHHWMHRRWWHHHWMNY